MGGGECWPVPLASKLLWVGLSSPICPVWSHLSLWALKQEEGSGCLHGLQPAPTTIRLSSTVAHNTRSLKQRLTQASAQTHLVPSQGQRRQGCKKKNPKEKNHPKSTRTSDESERLQDAVVSKQRVPPTVSNRRSHSLTPPGWPNTRLRPHRVNTT